MFKVLTSSKIGIKTTKFNTMSEACAYAYVNKHIFASISYDNMIMYNNIREENNRIIFENNWAKELLTWILIANIL